MIIKRLNTVINTQLQRSANLKKLVEKLDLLSNNSAIEGKEKNSYSQQGWKQIVELDNFEQHLQENFKYREAAI